MCAAANTVLFVNTGGIRLSDSLNRTWVRNGIMKVPEDADASKKALICLRRRPAITFDVRLIGRRFQNKPNRFTPVRLVLL